MVCITPVLDISMMYERSLMVHFWKKMGEEKNQTCNVKNWFPSESVFKHKQRNNLYILFLLQCFNIFKQEAQSFMPQSMLEQSPFHLKSQLSGILLLSTLEVILTQFLGPTQLQWMDSTSKFNHKWLLFLHSHKLLTTPDCCA